MSLSEELRGEAGGRESESLTGPSACVLWGHEEGKPEAWEVGQPWWTWAKCMTLPNSLLLKGGQENLPCLPRVMPRGSGEESPLLNPRQRLPRCLPVLVFVLVPKANGFETTFAETHVSLRKG